MGDAPRELVLIRHGETEWTITGQHTGRTDIPLTAAGNHEAKLLASRLAGRRFATVLTSPLQRAADTCRLAGFGDVAEITEDLLEWDYGDYEAMTTAQIREVRPTWTLWNDGVPRGEDARRVGQRVDRVLQRIRASDGNALLFAHGHVLRVLAARWLGLAPSKGRLFALRPATLSVLGYERETPVIRTWGDDHHLRPAD